MKYKHFILFSLIGILMSLTAVGLFVYKIDPYLQYHEPNDQLAYSLDGNSFAYINPGIVKNYSYDTIITGSSMSRSFLPTYIDQQLDCQTVKLSMAEARGKDFRDLLSFACRQDNLKRVIMGLDTFAFNVDKDFTSYEKPLYLYDDYLFNDMLYLANMKGLLESYETLKFTVDGGQTTSMDDYQNYAKVNTFSKEKVLEIYKKNAPITRDANFDQIKLNNTIIENLEKNLLPTIENNPEIEFIFYFPPYSIVRWGITENIEAEIYAMKLIAEQLLPYENVSIYFSQGNTEVITNLDYYMDTIHFNSEVANLIIDDIVNNQRKLTISNYQFVIDEFYYFVDSYDYDALISNQDQ